MTLPVCFVCIIEKESTDSGCSSHEKGSGMAEGQSYRLLINVLPTMGYLAGKKCEHLMYKHPWLSHHQRQHYLRVAR